MIYMHVEQGLADIILGQQTSMCVISNGAECILLDKDFYLHHATDALIQRLRLHEVGV